MVQDETEMLDFNVGVVLAAAGCGERMGSVLPKQYINILGKPLFLYALEEFLSVNYVKTIALVVDDVEMVTGLMQKYGYGDSEKIYVLLGGKTRHRSIKAGLHHLEKLHKCSPLKVVVVHDAVRPFVPKELLLDLVNAASLAGSAGPTKPLVSTVVKPNNESFLEISLKRNSYCASETPQAFQFELIFNAYNKSTEEELDSGTECLELILEHCSLKSKLIHTNEDLRKVTYWNDIHIVEKLIKVKTTDICIVSKKQSEVADVLRDHLKNKVATIQYILGWPTKKSNDNGKMCNTIILLHFHEVEVLEFTSIIDLDKEGLVIHIIDNASIDGLQNMSVYNLHRNSRIMAHYYEKLHKGVVVVHCFSNDLQKLVNIVTSLIHAHPLTFSGQTLFL